MSQERRIILLLLGFGFALVALSVAYPMMATVLFGFQTGAWPAAVIRPGPWFSEVLRLNVTYVIAPYIHLLFKTSEAFRGQEHWVLSGATASLVVLVTPAYVLLSPGAIKRDPSGVYGDARWANKRERAKMKEGLEFGIDPQSKRPIRVSFEGNLTTIAAPRDGKGSTLVIPNALVADDQAWLGSLVVFDPKGETYQVVADRRRKLGRHVLAIDPFNLVAGADRWNPLDGVDADDVMRLQRMAAAMLPLVGPGDTNSYFYESATDLIAAAMHVVIKFGDGKLSSVARLIRDPVALQELLEGSGEPVAEAALETCKLEPKERKSIFSTAARAFSWMLDRRGEALVENGSFTLRDLTEGNTDLFITLPTENIKVMAPFLKLLLSELFTAVRRSRPPQRMLVMIDEAATLGRFAELEEAWGELPGHGVSLWAFWQDRGQIISRYGPAVAGMFLRTSEFVTISDLAAIDSDELEFWSKALDDYTILDESETESTGGGTNGDRSSTSRRSQPKRLMSRGDLAQMSPNEVLLFPRSKRYGRHALRLRKTWYFKDQRFRGLFEDRKPVGGA